MNALQTFAQSPVGRTLSVLATGIMALLDLLLAGILPLQVRIFADMFQGLEVQLPWPTRWFLATYMWILPLLFISLGAFVIWKEFSARELRLKFLLTARVFVATLAVLALIIILLYLPVLVLASKLIEMK